MKTKIFLMIAGLMLVTFSCKKDSTLIDQTTLDDADYDAIADAVFNDVFSTADNATLVLEDMAKGAVEAGSCPIVTVTRPSATLWPKTVTLDYGTGCTGFNDNTRSGKVVIEVTGPRNEAGSKRTVTFVDYYFNEIKVEGTKVIENKGLNDNGHMVISITHTGGKLILPDGKTIERSIAHEREWIAGFETRNNADDECLITGVANGINRNGVQYTNTIISALHWKLACRFYVSGSIKMERSGEALPVIMDYGDGECDGKATVTRGDQTKEILLRSRVR